jgi:hypothetical protein
MGEAKRKRAAALERGPWPGGPGRCPVCLSTRVMTFDTPEAVEFYGRKITSCACGATWEPIDEADIWDRSDEHCCGKRPCDNCAFRPGSPELNDKAKWRELIAKLKAGGSFYCHKGVPIAPESEDGFAYPKDRHKLRLCRGYLDALGQWWKLEEVAP